MYFYSEVTLKKAPGNKLTKSASLPGQNGNPTFAAVAAGYDKSPGEFICQIAGDGKLKVVMQDTAIMCFCFHRWQWLR